MSELETVAIRITPKNKILLVNPMLGNHLIKRQTQGWTV
jgi:hypothetical protein